MWCWPAWRNDSGAIERVIAEVMAANPDQLADYRSGKDKLFGFFDVPGLGPGGIDPTAAYFEAIGLTPGLPLAVLAGVGSAFWGVVAGVFALLVQQWRPGGFRR